MKNYLCIASMDFEADDEEEACALMEQAMRNGDVVIECEEIGEP